MANIKANAKSSKKSKTIYLLNKTKKNSLKKLIKLAQTTKKKSDVDKVYKLADGLAQKHIIHKNKASNIKSKLTKLINKNEKK
ncbi:30S ribosomal protein S20 [bacterium]|nr:30S ribosomal protein S20 [bacterium]